jgi:hypothetical protein
MLQDFSFDEAWSEMLDADLKEFDAWEDEIEHGNGPKVQFGPWNKNISKSVDWRNEKNVVTPIKHQG